MKPTVEIQEKSDYLRFYIEGTDSLETSIAYFTEVAAECRNRGYKKALVVEALEEQVSTVEMFELGTKLPELLRGLKLAFVDLDTEHHSLNAFGETFVINRGCDVMVFATEREAAEWLTSSD